MPFNEEITELVDKKMIKKIEKKNNLKLIVYEDSYRKVRCLNRNENVIEFKGKLIDVKEGIQRMIKKLCKN